MKYKDGQVLEVRKVRWDNLWHVVYALGVRETYDRVTKEEAMEVIETYLS